VLPLARAARVVVVLDPDLVPTSLLRRLPGPRSRRRAVVVDISEDYLPLLRDRSWATGAAGLGARAVAASAERLARYADLTVVADEHVPPAQARRRLVVRNLPDLSHLPAAGERDPQPRAVYVGDVRRSRGVRTMLTALESAPAWSLDVVGLVSAEDEAWVDAWHARSSAARRVRFHGRLPPAEAWTYAAGAWAGLALLEQTPAFERALPSKVYEYLACGLAVVTTPLPRPSELVLTSGAGVVVRSVGEVSDTLNRWSDDPDIVDRMREAARDWAAQHLSGPSPYDELAAEVVALVRANERK
jgi:glycosyltransferase involved in cell wall biosynthesis